MNKLLLGTIIAILPAWVSGESLADAAKRERERRQQNEEAGTKPVRVITQDDVATNDSEGGAPNEPGQTSSDSSEANGSRGGADVSGESSASRGEEQAWRARGQSARNRVDAARKRAADTPEGITKVVYLQGGGTTTIVEPNPAYEAAQREVKAAEKALDDLEEEARRAGALPGWLR